MSSVNLGIPCEGVKESILSLSVAVRMGRLASEDRGKLASEDRGNVS